MKGDVMYQLNNFRFFFWMGEKGGVGGVVEWLTPVSIKLNKLQIICHQKGKKKKLTYLGGRREFLVPKGHRPGIGRLPCDQSLWNMKEREALSREKAERVLGQWISMGFYQMLWVNSQIEDHIVFSQNCHNHYLHQ